MKQGILVKWFLLFKNSFSIWASKNLKMYNFLKINFILL